jgi:hypothetical protein
MSEKPFWPLFFCICVTVLLRKKVVLSEDFVLAPSAIVSGYAPVGRLLTPVPKTRFVPQPTRTFSREFGTISQENLQSESVRTGAPR